MILCLSLDPKWSDLGWASTRYVLFLSLFFGLVGFSSKCPGLRSAWSELMLVVNTTFGKSILPQLCSLTALYLMSSHMQAGRPLGRLLQRSGGQRGETMKQRRSIKRDRRVRKVWFQSWRRRALRVKELRTPKGRASNPPSPPSLSPSFPPSLPAQSSSMDGAPVHWRKSLAKPEKFYARGLYVSPVTPASFWEWYFSFFGKRGECYCGLVSIQYQDTTWKAGWHSRSNPIWQLRCHICERLSYPLWEDLVLLPFFCLKLSQDFFSNLYTVTCDALGYIT